MSPSHFYTRRTSYDNKHAHSGARISQRAVENGTVHSGEIPQSADTGDLIQVPCEDEFEQPCLHSQTTDGQDGETYPDHFYKESDSDSECHDFNSNPPISPSSPPTPRSVSPSQHVWPNKKKVSTTFHLN